MYHMVKFTVLKRTSLILLLVALFSFFSLSPAFAQSETKALKDKLAQLESQLSNLEMVVKSLSLQLQQVADSNASTSQQFGPRLYSTEQIVKDNSFQIQRLTGTVADLSETVKQLAELPGEVAHAKDDIATLGDSLGKTSEELGNRIQATELGLSKLNESVDHAVALTNAMQANVGSLLSRMDAAEGKFSDLQGTVSSLSASMSTAQTHIADLQKVADQVTSLTSTVSALQGGLAQLAAQVDKGDARLSRLEDIVQRLGEFKQLQGLAERVQANGQQLAMLQEQVQAIMKQLGGTPQQPGDFAQKIDRLTAKLSDVLIEAENNKKTLADLQSNLSGLKAEVAGQVQSALAGVPSSAEIQSTIEQLTTKQVKQAEMKAEAANGLALIGLLAGLGALAVALLLR